MVAMVVDARKYYRGYSPGDDAMMMMGCERDATMEMTNFRCSEPRFESRQRRI
jgi:hypothetical protein